VIETLEVLLKEYELNSIENNNSYTVRNRNAKMQVKRNAPEEDESKVTEVNTMQEEEEKKENEDGEEFSEDYYFGLTILEPVINAPVDTPMEEETETAGQWWLSVIILAVAVIGIIAALVVLKRRNRA